MKANELMIFDWVRNTLLNEVFKMNTTSMRNMCWDEDHGMARYTIEPIPLTEEILTMNGWKDSDTNLFNGLNYVFIYGENGTLTLNHWTNRDKNEEYYTFAIGGGDRVLKYVHELQHALRVCGLNEFADNFKIE